MRIRRIVVIGLGVGAVALALAGCTETARGDGGGLGNGEGIGQGYRGARYAQTSENQEPSTRGFGRGQQAQSADEADALGAQRGAGGAGRGALSDTVEPASDRTGRDVAGAGTLLILSGTLATDDTEWYLDTTDGRFLLHLGNASYLEQTGLALEAGEAALVKGIVDADEVSVVSLEIDGKTYALRAEDGRPLWAGSGRGAGRGSGRGSGQGSGGDA